MSVYKYSELSVVFVLSCVRCVSSNLRFVRTYVKNCEIYNVYCCCDCGLEFTIRFDRSG